MLSTEGPAAEDEALQAAPTAVSTTTGSILAGLSWIDKLLPLWIIASMVLGVLLGYFVPQVGTWSAAWSTHDNTSCCVCVCVCVCDVSAGVFGLEVLCRTGLCCL